ncbi:2119_t:CDS:1, partial [Cetraspora pellucida]
EENNLSLLDNSEIQEISKNNLLEDETLTEEKFLNLKYYIIKQKIF